MVVFPNCKINLGLNILRKRTDGFHDLETVFYPVPLKDALEIVPSSISNFQFPIADSKLSDPPFEISNQKPAIKFTSSGLSIDGSESDNLCTKAYHLLKKDFPELPAIAMHLHKAIPMGAGLGGGSADAAFTLRLLNDKFSLGLSSQQLIQYALQLGSDCPFFTINSPCFASGRGEVLDPITIQLSGYRLVLVNPGIHINTGWAFSTITPSVPIDSIKTIVQQPVTDWKNLLTNDFESPVFSQYPTIKAAKEQLYDKGAVYAAMTGSGSTLYGLFNNDTNPVFDFSSSWLVKNLVL